MCCSTIHLVVYNILTAGHAAADTRAHLSGGHPASGARLPRQTGHAVEEHKGLLLCLNISPVMDQRDTRAVSEAVIPQAEQGDQGQPVMPTRDTRACVTCLCIYHFSRWLFGPLSSIVSRSVTLAYCPRGPASTQRAAAAGPEAALSATSCPTPLLSSSAVYFVVRLLVFSSVWYGS